MDPTPANIARAEEWYKTADKTELRIPKKGYCKALYDASQTYGDAFKWFRTTLFRLVVSRGKLTRPQCVEIAEEMGGEAGKQAYFIYREAFYDTNKTKLHDMLGISREPAEVGRPEVDSESEEEEEANDTDDAEIEDASSSSEDVEPEPILPTRLRPRMPRIAEVLEVPVGTIVPGARREPMRPREPREAFDIRRECEKLIREGKQEELDKIVREVKKSVRVEREVKMREDNNVHWNFMGPTVCSILGRPYIPFD